MGDSSATPSDYGRRAASYWFIDGLPQIIAGLELAVWGGVAIWLGYLLPSRWMALPGFLIGVVIWFLLVGADRRIVEFLKARVTYPRTGYVRPPAYAEEIRPVDVISLREPAAADENVTHFRRRTVIVLWSGWPLFNLVQRPWGLPAVMAVVAVTLYALNRKTETPYRWWSVIPLVVAGALSMWLDVPAGLRRWLPPLIGGVWLLAQGLWTLVSYLRANPEGVRA